MSGASRGAHLAIQGLYKRYGDVQALAPTDLDVAQGEFFALIGPSGSGKSTLLGSIAGFVPPSGGRILVGGVDVVSVPPYRRNIGMVFQNYALFPHMVVFDNIAFPLRMRKVAETEIRTRVERMLAVVRLEGMGARRTSQLSGGQQQRVALARAAVYDPPLLLMDEPLGALDKNLREEMQDEIKQFHRQIGATVLYVTHDQDEAARLSDRIAIVNHGRIVQVGAPRELYEAPCNSFVASFLGEANLFPIQSVAPAVDGTTLEIGGGMRLATTRKPPEAATGAGIMACVRPEAIGLNHRTSAAAGNTVEGIVDDAVYTAGMLRYRVRVSDSIQLTVRQPPGHAAHHAIPGERVVLSWRAEDTLLVPRE
ncbi:MAG: ABC transporter ATP-binding protein [Alphaproteobacteria bacterium]|nr:ABC transporter ATP-binding protein [Alphaproteobacteria bacterium]